MPKPARKASAAVNADLPALPSKVTFTPLGLDVTHPLTLAEWQDVGRSIGAALRSAAFVVGDWLIYGEGRRGQTTLWAEIPAANRVEGWLYEEAAQLTGLDVATLQNYAYVARRVPRSLRNEHLSWEHHKKVAKLKEPGEQSRWLSVAAELRTEGNPVSVRRFARSIQAGRLLSADELEGDDADAGIENVHPYVNRIVAFFARLKESGWLKSADEYKRAALKRDLQPIIDIHEQL
jgi:hypothetical protein